MSGMGCPILGDVKYGGEEKARGQIALCASSLTFVHPKTKKQMQFEIPPQAAGFDLFFCFKNLKKLYKGRWDGNTNITTVCR